MNMRKIFTHAKDFYEMCEQCLRPTICILLFISNFSFIFFFEVGCNEVCDNKVI